MVSFLGLRFGGDKKKLQKKQQEAEKSAKKWKKGGQDSLGSDQSFGHDLSRPQLPPSRPGSSFSTRSTILFRSPFANSAATSSMVDLAPPSPRRPSAGSLRQAASISNLKGGRPIISGPIGPPVTLPLGGDPSQVGMAPRPGTAGSSKKEWANMLEVHGGKDMGGARPYTSAGPSALRSPLSQCDFDIGPPANEGRSGNHIENSIGPNGYPSPPPSVASVEQGLTRVNTEPKLSQSSKPPAPSSLRRVKTAEQTRLPSPPVSEDRPDGPVVRNVMARRETMTFHSPRRRSFNKNIDDGVAKRPVKDRSEQEKAEIKKRRQTEGFEGNFAGFNFGAPAVDTSIAMPTEMSISPTTSAPREDLSVDPKMVSPPVAAERRSVKLRGMSQPTTTDSMDLDRNAEDGTPDGQTDAESPRRPSTQSTRWDRSLSGPNGARRGHSTSVESFPRPARPRVDSDTRCPDTPTALRAPPPVTDRNTISTIRSSQSSQGGQSSERFDATPPPKLDPDRRSQSPLRSKTPIEGDFSLRNGLPRGRRPSSPNSQRGRSRERFEEAAPPMLNPDRRSQSPLRARQPAAGQFPVSKGLPRGRPPAAAPAPIIAPASLGTGAPPPRPPRESEGITTIPGWANRTEKHLSALPAPLSPLPARIALNDEDISTRAAKSPTTPLLGPPRLPSPTFPSLEESITDNFTKAIDDIVSESTSKPLISPVLSEFGVRLGDGRNSPIRVEAKKAPPRSLPIPLTNSKGEVLNSTTNSPTASEFSPAFI